MSLVKEPLLAKKEKKSKVDRSKFERYIHKGDVLDSSILSRLFFCWAYRTIKVFLIN